MVAFRAAAASQNRATQVSVTVPTSGPGGTVAVGDIAYLGISACQQGSTTGWSTPSGWTELLAPQSFNSNTQIMAMCYKVLDAGDLGAVLTYGALASSRCQTIGVAIYSEGAHDTGTTLLVDSTEDVNVLSPTIDPTADDCMLVNFAFCNGVATTGTLITVTPTSGWNERLDVGTSGNTGNEEGTIFVQDRLESGGGPFSAVTATASEAVDDGTVMIAIAHDPAEEPPPAEEVYRPRVFVFGG